MANTYKCNTCNDTGWYVPFSEGLNQRYRKAKCKCGKKKERIVKESLC